MARWTWIGVSACAAVVAGCGGGAARTLADPGAATVPPSSASSATAPVPPRSETPTSNPYADLPVVVRAEPEPLEVDDNTLAPGAAIPTSAIGQRATAAGGTVYGLADRGSLFGSSYPAVSTDGGDHWRIDGPIFSRAAANGASGASGIFVTGKLVCVPGVDGNFVRVTTDGGRHWLRATFGVVGSVTFRAGRLIAAVQSSPINAANVYSTRTYVSTDDGTTWYLQAATPAGVATYGG